MLQESHGVFYRTIGPWHVSAGIMEDGRQDYGEDGPYWRTIRFVFVQAAHQRGKIYTAIRDFATLDEAKEFLCSLPADFDARKSEDFSFWRTSYGSSDWGPEDEWDMMSDGEKDHALKSGYTPG